MNERRILVVDDEPAIRKLYTQAFSRAGYEVTVAENAEDALELFNKEQFWVLILDLSLPGMSGVELCRELTEAYPMVIPYAVTGFASLFELADCREAGFEDYFIKPVNMSDLLEAIDYAFRKLDRWKKR